MKKFTGNDLRELRKRHRLKRSELAKFIGVSAVTIEKWEQHGENQIRPKYLDKVAALNGVSAVGIGVAAFAAPALLPFAAVLGAGTLLSNLLSDGELEKTTTILNGLKKLSLSERKKLMGLVKKMEG